MLYVGNGNDDDYEGGLKTAGAGLQVVLSWVNIRTDGSTLFPHYFLVRPRLIYSSVYLAVSRAPLLHFP